jgi:hypothetical protein
MTNPPRKKLPVGIQTLSEIVGKGFYYVDKTPYALRLVEQSKYIFLSRPRRFGKSLFLDTLKELFEGNRDLFAGLYAEEHWDWSHTHPVIRLSFGEGVMRNREDLDARIRYQLSTSREQLGIPDAAHSYDIPGDFQDLIASAHAKYGAQAVVLVDEYDKPILDNLTQPDAAIELREGLKNFYSVLKGADPHLRFCMVTGVSKFSKVSLFSGLNNLNDITLDRAYSALCGYTDHDIDTVFAPELPGLDRKKIREWYNGYNWRGESVYNPFDLLLLFDKREFNAWWFESAPPSFLVKAIVERGFYTPRLEKLQTSLDLLGRFDVEDFTIEAMLFQMGYLTIHEFEEPIPGLHAVTLGYPNLGVKTSLNKALLPAFGLDASLA